MQNYTTDRHKIGLLKSNNLSPWIWRLCGYASLLTCIYLIGSGRLYKLFTIDVMNLIIAVGSMYFGFWCIKRAKKIQKKIKRISDHRPPILYLRSFKADSKVSKVTRYSMSGFNFKTEEEQFAEVMNELGPFTAVGKPGEKLPHLGANRIYITNDNWQDEVQHLIFKARITVFLAGDSSGFWWEVKKATQIIKPENLLFLLPFNEKSYEIFREKAGSYFPYRLPEYKGYKISNGSLRAALYFDYDWTPHLIPLKGSRFQYWFLQTVSYLATGILGFIISLETNFSSNSAVASGELLGKLIMVLMLVGIIAEANDRKHSLANILKETLIPFIERAKLKDIELQKEQKIKP